MSLLLLLEKPSSYPLILSVRRSGQSKGSSPNPGGIAPPHLDWLVEAEYGKKWLAGRGKWRYEQVTIWCLAYLRAR
jgi:hypothetical protein